jgi:hypothetical protein
MSRAQLEEKLSHLEERLSLIDAQICRIHALLTVRQLFLPKRSGFNRGTRGRRRLCPLQGRTRR